MSGRPRIELDLALVERVAGMGATDEELAAFLEVSAETIRLRKREPEFLGAYKKGRAAVRISLRRAQMALAMKGNAAMLIWLGRQILGQKDKLVIEQDPRAALAAALGISESELPALEERARRGAGPGGREDP